MHNAHEGYEYFRWLDETTREYSYRVFQNLDNWLLTISSGSFAISLALISMNPNLASNADRFMLVSAWSALVASIVSGLISKGLTHLEANRLAAAVHQCTEGDWETFPSRVAIAMKGAWLRRSAWTFGLFAFLMLLAGLVLLLLFADSMLEHVPAKLGADETVGGNS